MESPFDVLDIDPDADDADVERAYRRQVKATHPDQGGSMEEFLRVRAAYERITAGDAAAPDDAADPEDTADSPRQSPTTEVEYLDYEALVDHGWSLDDPDLFEKAADADLEPPTYGHIEVGDDDFLLQEVEAHGCTWPFSCRGGACANCAVAVREGDLSMPANHVLPAEMLDRGIRLSCIGTATSDVLKVVYNVKHLPDLDELRLPPRPYEQALDD